MSVLVTGLAVGVMTSAILLAIAHCTECSVCYMLWLGAFRRAVVVATGVDRA